MIVLCSIFAIAMPTPIERINSRWVLIADDTNINTQILNDQIKIVSTSYDSRTCEEQCKIKFGEIKSKCLEYGKGCIKQGEKCLKYDKKDAKLCIEYDCLEYGEVCLVYDNREKEWETCLNSCSEGELLVKTISTDNSETTKGYIDTIDLKTIDTSKETQIKIGFGSDVWEYEEYIDYLYETAIFEYDDFKVSFYCNGEKLDFPTASIVSEEEIGFGIKWQLEVPENYSCIGDFTAQQNILNKVNTKESVFITETETHYIDYSDFENSPLNTVSDYKLTELRNTDITSWEQFVLFFKGLFGYEPSEEQYFEIVGYTHTWTGEFYDFDPSISIINVTLRNTLTQQIQAEAEFSHIQINDSSLVVYYPFDVNSRDYSNNNKDGTLNGNAFVNTSSGVYGGALQLDGTGDYITEGDTNLTYMTASYWIKFNEAVSNELIAGQRDGTTTIKWQVFRVQTDNDIRFRVDTSASDNMDSATSTWTAGQWYMMTFTYDGTNMSIYVNGVLDATKAHGTGGRITGVSRSLSIGRLTGETTADVNGSIDEFMLFNRSLSQTEIQQIYNSTYQRFYPNGNQTFRFQNITLGTDNRINLTIEAQTLNGSSLNATTWEANVGNNTGYVNTASDNSLVGYWHGDGNALDYSGNGNDGTFAGNANASAPGVFNSSFGFDGNGDYVDTGNEFNYTNNITVSAWIKAKNKTIPTMAACATSSTIGSISTPCRLNGFILTITGFTDPTVGFQTSGISDGSFGIAQIGSIPAGHFNFTVTAYNNSFFNYSDFVLGANVANVNTSFFYFNSTGNGWTNANMSVNNISGKYSYSATSPISFSSLKFTTYSFTPIVGKNSYGLYLNDFKPAFNSGNLTGAGSSSSIPLDTWTLVTATKSSVGGTSLYINGVLDAVNANDTGNMPTDTDNLLIGMLSNAHYFNGSIDEIMIFNRSLSADEIKSLYITGSTNHRADGVGVNWTTTEGEKTLTQQNISIYDYSSQCANSSSGLVSAWLADASGYNDTCGIANLTPVSMAYLSTRTDYPALNGSYTFEGNDDYLNGSYPNYRSSDHKGTLCFWIKPFTLGAYTRFFTSSDLSDSNRFISFGLNGNNLVMGYERLGGSGTVTGNSNVTLNTWTFGCVSSNGTAYSIYYNGYREITSGATTGVWFSNVSDRDNVVLGTFLYSAGPSIFYELNGSIDEVSLWNRSLSSDEILQLYYAGTLKHRNTFIINNSSNYLLPDFKFDSNDYNFYTPIINNINLKSWFESETDTTPPTLYVQNITATEGEAINYDFNATDASGIDYWWINDTGNFAIDQTGQFTNATTLSVGTYWVNISVNDTLSNVASQIIYIEIYEPTPEPTVSIDMIQRWEVYNSTSNNLSTVSYVNTKGYYCRIENNESICMSEAVADGTYTVGIGTTTNGTITIKDGIITAIQEAN